MCLRWVSRAITDAASESRESSLIRVMGSGKWIIAMGQRSISGRWARMRNDVQVTMSPTVNPEGIGDMEPEMVHACRI